MPMHLADPGMVTRTVCISVTKGSPETNRTVGMRSPTWAA